MANGGSLAAEAGFAVCTEHITRPIRSLPHQTRPTRPIASLQASLSSPDGTAAGRQAGAACALGMGAVGANAGGHSCVHASGGWQEDGKEERGRPSLLEEARDARRKLYAQMKKSSVAPVKSAAFTVVSRQLAEGGR